MSDNLRCKLCSLVLRSEALLHRVVLVVLLALLTESIVLGAAGSSERLARLPLGMAPVRDGQVHKSITSGGLVSPELLESAKLKILWDNELPIEKGESLERLVVLGERIYAFSNRNYMFSLDRQGGKMISGKSIASAGLPVVGLEHYEDKLISIVGNRFVEIDPQTCMVRSVYYPEFSIVCPAARNSSYLYLAGADRRLHMYRLDDKVQVFEAAAENNSKITSIIADENFVIFSTDAGNLISVAPDRPVKLWQFDAGGGIVGPVVRDESSLFFACKDTCIYRFDMVNTLKGNLIWKYQTNAVLDKAPRITQEVVYQRVGYKGLAAIDKESGELLWQLDEGDDLLAEAKEKAYVITKVKALAVMDNNERKKLYSVNFAQVSRYAANMIDSKIYIADESGRVACIEPVE